MSSFLCSDLTQLLSRDSLVKEEVSKVVGSGVDKATTPVQLWAQYFAITGSNILEFIGEREIEDPKLIFAIGKIIGEAEAELKGIEDLIYPLSTLLKNNHFSQEDVAKVVASGVDEATTPIELWAQYFATTGSNILEFIGEREIEDPRLINAIKGIIFDVEQKLKKL